MSPEAELYARVALVVPFVLAAGLVWAIALRYRGRSLPDWAALAGAFLLGFALSANFVFFISEPIFLIATCVPVLWIAFLLARSGRFRHAGLAVLGLCLPGALWWGRFYYQDVVDPAPLYDEAIRLWFLVPLVGAIMGIGLFVMGDRSEPVPRVMRRPPNAVRDPMTLGGVLSADVAIGIYPLPSLVAELLALSVTVAVITAGTAIGLPWPLLIIGGGLVFMLTATELWYLAFPRASRKPWEAFSYVGHLELERWRAATGTPAPNTEAKMRAWLRDNEERPETRWAHAELLAVVGRLDEARAMAQRIETATPLEEFDRQALVDYIEWIDGAEIDHDARLREADALGPLGSPPQLYARGLATIALARDRAHEGGDWRTPLVEFQRLIGPAGWTSLRQDTRGQRMVATLLLGLLLSGLFVIPFALQA